MQDIIVEKPYKFVPPWKGTFLPAFVNHSGLFDWYLRHHEGVVDHELRGGELLKESIDRGDGILLAPNHCRYADPLLMVYLARQLKAYPHAMASWHLFNEGWLRTFGIRAVGAFSIFREGSDRESLETAIEILAEGSRPLLIFPEGTVSRTNDRLQPMLDGISMIARAAAKRRLKAGSRGRVVVHPMAIKYVPVAPVATMVEPILQEIEQRFTWEPRASGPRGMVERLNRAMHGLLCIKEIEYFGTPQCGSWSQRQTRLVDELLRPLEMHYLRRPGEGHALQRIKALRSHIVPLLLEATDAQRDRLWGQQARTYLAQQVASYPHDYLEPPTTSSRVLETAERLYEDLFDRNYRVGPLKAILEIAPAIEVAPQKPRGDEPDLMDRLRGQLQGMLERLSAESPPWPPPERRETSGERRE